MIDLKGIHGSLPSLSVDQASAGLVRDRQLALVPAVAGVQSMALPQSIELSPVLESQGRALPEELCELGGSALTTLHSICAGGLT